MTEAAGVARPLEAQGAEATRLIALLERSEFAEADSLTTKLAAETVTWLDAPDAAYTAAQCAEKVKQWWVGTYQRILGKEDAEDTERIWVGSVARKKEALAERAELAGALDAAIAKAAEPKADQPEQAKESEPPPHGEQESTSPEEDGAEAIYCEDSENQANDIRRKLWRLAGALKFIRPGQIEPERVGAVIWRLSGGGQEGRQCFVDWLGAKGAELWAEGFAGARWCGVEELWEIAQRAGWRYPIAQNLNRLDEMVEQTEAALVRGKAEIYQAGDQLVRPVQIEVDATKGRKTNVAVLVQIDHPFLKTQLTRLIDYFRWDSKDQRAGIGASSDVVYGLLRRYGKWKFPAVTGIVTAPTLRRDGSVLAREGWDLATGLLVMGPLPLMPKLAAEPSREDAERAVRMLDQELLGEFPFCDEASKAAALSGLITPNVRGALSCVPLHAFSAPTPGTGKSFLCDVAAGVALGDAMPNMAAGANTEEMEKRLGAMIIRGLIMFSIDNVTMPIGGDALCQTIERPTFRHRILGKSEVKERRNIWCLFATGNNLRLRDDVTRRTLLIRMDAKEERPELRQFKANPFERVLANRGRYIWAALTVVLAYRAADTPGKLPPIGDPFAEWSDNVRSALVWLGYADPVETMNEAREHDPSRQARRAMLWAMFNAYASEPRTAAQMISDAKTGMIAQPGKHLLDAKINNAAADLKAAITQYTSDRLDAKYFGTKLNTDISRITDNLQLCCTKDLHSKTNIWWVERVGAERRTE